MRRCLRVFLVLLLFAGLLAATGFVMARNRRLSLFLSARDRIERGEPEKHVLADLSEAVDWSPDDGSRARRIAAQTFDSPAPRRDLAVHEYDGWALITWSPHGALLARQTSRGWRAVR